MFAHSVCTHPCTPACGNIFHTHVDAYTSSCTAQSAKRWPGLSAQCHLSLSPSAATTAAGTRRRVGLHALPGGCQVGYMCDQNSTYGLHALAVIHRCF
jgi:hypothetical protein